jgi:hypothetical protein
MPNGPGLTAEWVSSELGRGCSSVVTLKVESNGSFMAEKTLLNPKEGDLIQREVAILKKTESSFSNKRTFD